MSHRTWRALLASSLSLVASGCIVWAPVNVGTPAGPAGIVEVVVKESRSWVAPGKVAILGIDGVISTGEDGGVLGSTRNMVSDVVAQLQRARRDEEVRAIVLRIDSPGGSVTASDLIYREVQRFRKETGRPVIACMMDTAASGGYYVAMAADSIWALPTTTTGSIGVVTQLLSVEGLFEKLGLEQRTFTSGALKDAGSPYKQMSEADRDMIQGLVDAMYARFVDVVVAGRRGLDRARITKLADGRVFTADQALQEGLVDHIGYLDEAVAAAAEAAGLADPEVVTYRLGWGRPANLYASLDAQVQQRAVDIDLGLGRWLPSLGARLLYLWQPGL